MNNPTEELLNHETSTTKCDDCRSRIARLSNSLDQTLISDDLWVILIWDPGGRDTSPWSVVAPNLKAAIAQAKADWLAWLYDPQNPNANLGKPVVHKAYRGSWIGERVL